PSTLNMGLVNARSMVNKTALIHDVIADNRLDLLAVTETWVYKDLPDVLKKEAAPHGYSISHAHHLTTTGGGQKQHGGGVALIHREDIQIKIIPTTLASTRTFELLLAKVINSTVGLTIAVIYRPPGSMPGITDFAAELSNLIDTVVPGSRYILCGDLTCPGPP